MGLKLTILGAAGAAVLAGIGVASMAYKYYGDPDAGAQRRKATLNVVNGFVEKAGFSGIEKNLMATFMERMAGTGK